MKVARDLAEQREEGYVVNHKTSRYFKDQRIIRECERRVPREYIDYPEAAKAWIQGCIKREKMLLQEMYDQAYQDGLNGRR